MQSYTTIRDTANATERYGAWVEYSTSSQNSFKRRIVVLAYTDPPTSAATTYTTTQTASQSGEGNGITNSYTRYGSSKAGSSNSNIVNETTTQEQGKRVLADTSFSSTSSYASNTYNSPVVTVSSTYTSRALRTYVDTSSSSAYQSTEKTVSNGNFSFPLYSTRTSSATTTAWTNKTQTKTSTNTTYWRGTMSFLAQGTTSTTKTSNATQTYQHNTTKTDSFTTSTDYTYTKTSHGLGGTNQLIDTIVFNNAVGGGYGNTGSKYLNGGAAYTLSAAVGSSSTVIGKFTDLFGLQTDSIFTFEENQVYLTSSRSDLQVIKKYSVVTSTRPFPPSGGDSTMIVSVIDGTTMTASNTSIYSQYYTTEFNFSGISSYEIEIFGETESAFSHTEFTWGYSYPANAAPIYTEGTQSTPWLGERPRGGYTKMFYQTVTHTTKRGDIQELGTISTTHLVTSYISYSTVTYSGYGSDFESGNTTGYTEAGLIKKSSTITYSKNTTTSQDVVTPIELVPEYSYSNLSENSAGNKTFIDAGATEGASYTWNTNVRMYVKTLAGTSELYSNGSNAEIVHSCLPIGYAGAGNSYNASQQVNGGIVVARHITLNMVNGETFNTSDIFYTSDIPTAVIFDHVTYFPDSIPSSWTQKPEKAALISYLSSVGSMGNPASIKVWWTSTTETSTTFPSYKVFKGATSESKRTTTSRYTVRKATYVLSTNGAITGDFLTRKGMGAYEDMGNGFTTGYCDINTINMPTPVSVKFNAGAINLTYQVTGNSGASSSGTFSSSNSLGQVSFEVTNGKPFAFLVQPIISLARSTASSYVSSDNIVSTFKYIPPASY